MHDVLWVLWGKMKQGDWGAGKLSICESGKERHRMVLMGMSKETARLNHVSVAHTVESRMFVEMALSIWIEASCLPRGCDAAYEYILQAPS